MLPLLLAVLLASPALDEARGHLAKGKLDGVLFALLPQDAVPAEKSREASALLVDAARLALARKDKTLGLQLSLMAHRRDAKNGGALKLLVESALRDTELKTAVKYGKLWVEAEPQSEEAKGFLARAEELDRSWTPPAEKPKRKARSRRAAASGELQVPKQRSGRILVAGQAAPSEGPTVIVYGTSWCPACRKALEWLQANGIRHENKDIEKDPAAARELHQKRMSRRMRGRGIPVIDVGGILIEGFSPRAVRAALERKGG